MTLQQAITVEFDKYLDNCNQASQAQDAVEKAKNLRMAHIHYKALIRLRKSI